MHLVRRPLRSASLLALLFLTCGLSVSQAAETAFPFDRAMLLDTAPMRGSKRLPGLQIAENGAAEIDLWCVSGRGQAVIAENSITIVPSSMQNNQCTPEQLTRDEELLKDLTDAATWRRDGDVVVLTGGKTLRYRISTN